MVDACVCGGALSLTSRGARTKGERERKAVGAARKEKVGSDLPNLAPPPFFFSFSVFFAARADQPPAHTPATAPIGLLRHAVKHTPTPAHSAQLTFLSLCSWCSLPPSTAQMDGVLFAALSGALSHVGPDRGACEANLKALADQPGFCSALLVRAGVRQRGGRGASKKSEEGGIGPTAFVST